MTQNQAKERNYDTNQTNDAETQKVDQDQDKDQSGTPLPVKVLDGFYQCGTALYEVIDKAN